LTVYLLFSFVIRVSLTLALPLNGRRFIVGFFSREVYRGGWLYLMSHTIPSAIIHFKKCFRLSVVLISSKEVTLIRSANIKPV